MHSSTRWRQPEAAGGDSNSSLLSKQQLTGLSQWLVVIKCAGGHKIRQHTTCQLSNRIWRKHSSQIITIDNSLIIKKCNHCKCKEYFTPGNTGSRILLRQLKLSCSWHKGQRHTSRPSAPSNHRAWQLAKLFYYVWNCKVYLNPVTLPKGWNQ